MRKRQTEKEREKDAHRKSDLGLKNAATGLYLGMKEDSFKDQKPDDKERMERKEI